MRSKNARYIVMAVGVFVAIVAFACGGTSPTASPVPTATSAPAAAAPASPTAQPAATATQAPAVVPTAGPTAATSVTSAGGAFTWVIEDVDVGAKPALALTSDNVPHVAYMLEAMPGFVKNAVRNGSSWDVTTIADGYFYGPLDIAIGPNDTPYVIYHDHQDDRFKPEKGDATLAVLSNGQWSVDALLDEGHDGWDTRIVVDANGKVHVSAIDPKEFDGDGVEYYSQDDSGQWSVEEVGSGSLTYKYGTAIAVDVRGNPCISYHDQENKDLVLASNDGSTWTITTVDSEGNTGLFSSILIGQDGRMHISYLLKDVSGFAGTVKYATKGPGDSTWELREVDDLPDLSFGFIGARNITSVAVDSKGNPWVAYSDERVVKLAVWEGSTWLIETVVDSEDIELGQLVSLKLDSRDQPHIAYFEVSDKSPLNGRIKYAKGTAN